PKVHAAQDFVFSNSSMQILDLEKHSTLRFRNSKIEIRNSEQHGRATQTNSLPSPRTPAAARRLPAIRQPAAHCNSPGSPRLAHRAASALSCLRAVANTSWITLRSSRNAPTTFWARARSSSLRVSTSGRTESHSDSLIVCGLPATTSCAKSTRSLGSQGQSAATIPLAALRICSEYPLTYPVHCSSLSATSKPSSLGITSNVLVAI